MSAKPRILISCAMPTEAAPFLQAASSYERLEVKDGKFPAYEFSFPSVDQPLLLITSGIGLVCAAMGAQWALDNYELDLIISAGTAGGLGLETEVGDVVISDSAGYGSADATAFGYEPGQVPGQPVFFPCRGGAVIPNERLEAVLDGSAANTTNSAMTSDPDSAISTPQSVKSETKNSPVDVNPFASALLHLTQTSEKPEVLSLSRRHLGRILSGDVFVTARNVETVRRTFPAAKATDMETAALAQVAYAHDVAFLSVRGVSDLCGPQAGQDHHLNVDLTATLSALTVWELLRQ